MHGSVDTYCQNFIAGFDGLKILSRVMVLQVVSYADCMDRQADRQARQTGRKTAGQMDRQTDRRNDIADFVTQFMYIRLIGVVAL